MHNVHNDAVNIIKTSRLLGCKEPQHCLAHVLNLLLVNDGLSKCPEVQQLLEKCQKIVMYLSFKSSAIINESLDTNDDVNVYNKLRRMAEVREIVNLNEQFPVTLIASSNDNDDRLIGPDGNDDHEYEDNQSENNYFLAGLSGRSKNT